MDRLPLMNEAAFVFPVIGDRLHLAQRATPPNGELYGPAGGKLDRPGYRYSEGFRENVWNALWNTTWRTDRRAIDAFDGAMTGYERLNLEHHLHAAVREVYEELKPGTDIETALAQGDLPAIAYIGSAVDHSFSDEQKAWRLHFYIADMGAEGIAPSPREITRLTPANEVAGEAVWPLARVALEDLFWRSFDPADACFAYRGLRTQIPEFPGFPAIAPLDDVWSDLIALGSRETRRLAGRKAAEPGYERRSMLGRFLLDLDPAA